MGKAFLGMGLCRAAERREALGSWGYVARRGAARSAETTHETAITQGMRLSRAAERREALRSWGYASDRSTFPNHNLTPI